MNTPSAADALNDVIHRHWHYTMERYPEQATYVGHPGQDHRWSDLSAKALESAKESNRRFLKEIRSIQPGSLEEPDQLNHRLLTWHLEMAVEGDGFPDELMPLSPMGGPHSHAANIIDLMKAEKVPDFENIVSRLEALPKLLAQSTALMREGLAKGITQPKVVLRNAADQVASQVVDDAWESPLLRKLVDAPESTKRAGAKAFDELVGPAMKQFHEFVSDEYVVGCRESIARTELTDGEDWYAHAVRRYTTTSMSPKEIHEVGLDEVKRIRASMDGVLKSSGFEGTFEEFTTFLREDPQFYCEDPESLLVAYRDICKRADAELARLFGRLPRLPYGVKAVPSYIEKTTTTAYYQPGAAEAGRAGYFFANTYDLSSRPKWEMEALSLHEAVPGHHLQIALAQELEGLPEFRRHGRFTAFTEGWGLYSESLGEEMGFYTDPYSKFGQLTYEMWRAIRLVVDTGMHALGWTRDQAIEYFKANTGKAEHDIVVEVDRYISWPGQALAYKIGELKFQELRAAQEHQLGDEFDIRRFHDLVLGKGAVPLEVLEEIAGT